MSWKEPKDQGNLAYKAGRMAEAIEKYTEALVCEDITDEERVKVLTNRAQCHLREKDYHAVVEDCTAALEFDGGNFKALFRRASAEEQLGLKADAIRDYKAVLAVNSTIAQARDGLRRLDPSAAELRAKARGGVSGGRGGVSTTSIGAGGPREARKEPGAEEMRALAVAEARVKSVARQIAQAQARGAAGLQELRQVELQAQVVDELKGEERTYRAAGRAFLLCPQEELRGRLKDSGEAAKKRMKVAGDSLQYLHKRQLEAHEAFIDAYNDARRSMGEEPVPRDRFVPPTPIRTSFAGVIGEEGGEKGGEGGEGGEAEGGGGG